MHDAVKIAHLTSAHGRYDTRIYLKMCSSLARHGYNISLIVSDGKGDEIKDGVTIYDVGTKPQNRLLRMTKTVSKVFVMAKTLNADIYHLHDPELIPIGIKLKRLGKKVIFDAHEDLPQQLLSKPYLNKLILKALSVTAEKYENYTCSRFDGIVAATPYIREKFLKINSVTQDINNFPMQNEFTEAISLDKKMEVAYVGGIGSIRGIREMVKACEHLKTDTKLNLVGHFSEKKLKEEVEKYTGWRCVNEFGFMDRTGIQVVLKRSIAGLVILHPVINYLDALPVKMFEYMSAGIPVIASNFPLWREIVEGNNCGLCVDPLNPKAIAEAIDFLAVNLLQAKAMGENGRRAVLEKYNWQNEEKKLFSFYDEICKGETD